MPTMKHWNKKGQDEASPNKLLVGILIALIILTITLALIKSFSNKTSSTIDAKSDCSGLIGKGECKSECDINKEQSFENALGCPPKDAPEKRFCCISLEKSEESTQSYGQTTDYQFSVEYIGIKNKDACQSTATSYVCNPGTVLELYVKVKNTGKNSISVTGNPKIIKDENVNPEWGYGKSATVISPGEAKDFVDAGTVTIDDNTQSYKIFAAAKCAKDVCTGASDAGVFVINPNTFLVITTSTQ